MTTLADIRELLLELELDVDRQLLDTAPLTGLTAERWSSASAALHRAWEAQIVTAHDQDETLRSTIAGVEEAAAVVREAGAIWETLTPRLAPLGPCAEYDRLTTALRSDPLGFDPAWIDALEQAIELREQGVARIAAARALLEQVEEAQRAGETAHRDALEKVAAAKVPEPVQALSDLDAGLHMVESLLAQEEFDEARDALARWTNGATKALHEARSVAAANRAPVERRNQLRGLLKAYEGKARGVRALEREEVADLFEQAERALYTAPVDLDTAGELVARYGRALNRSEAGP